MITVDTLTTFLDKRYSHYDKAHSPGLILAVKQGDEVVIKGYGRANAEFDIPWAADTKYRIASVTKQFIGMTMLLLEREGKLSLEDDIRRYLPEMPNYGRTITIKHLLQMTSGIKLEEDILGKMVGDEGPASLEHQYTLVTQLSSLNFIPGEAMLYSCANYRLAARLIEKVTGKNLHDVFTDLIFAPLGMTDSSSHPDYDFVIPNLAYLYLKNPDGYHRYGGDIQMSGDGAIISTMRDMLKWDEALRKKFFGDDLFTKLTAVPMLGNGLATDYGLGIGVETYRGQRLISHDGLFGTSYLRALDADVAVFVISNIWDIDAGAEAYAVVDLLLTQTTTSSHDHEQLAVQALLQDWQGQYVSYGYGYILTIKPDDGSLRVNLFGNQTVTVQGDYELASRSGLRFRLDQQRQGFLIHVDMGKSDIVTFERVDTVPMFDAGNYLATYYNAEIDIRQKIIMRDGVLTLQLGRGQVAGHFITLEAVANNIFLADGRTLKFTRDNSGTITGFSESIARARDVSFIRVPDSKVLVTEV